MALVLSWWSVSDSGAGLLVVAVQLLCYELISKRREIGYGLNGVMILFLVRCTSTMTRGA